MTQYSNHSLKAKALGFVACLILLLPLAGGVNAQSHHDTQRSMTESRPPIIDIPDNIKPCDPQTTAAGQASNNAQDSYIGVGDTVFSGPVEKPDALYGDPIIHGTEEGDLFVLSRNKGGSYLGYSLIKYSNRGDLVFQKKYEADGEYRYFHTSNITKFKNGDLLLTARAAKVQPEHISGIKNPGGAGKEGIYLARIKQSGELVWSRFHTSAAHALKTMISSDDHIKIMAKPMSLIDFDSKGQALSLNHYSKSNYDLSRAGVPLDDGTIMITGFRSYHEPNDRGVFYTRESNDPYIAQIDQDGKIVWDKRYVDKHTANHSIKLLKKNTSGFYLMYATYLSKRYYDETGEDPEYTKQSLDDIEVTVVSSLDKKGETLWNIKLSKGVSLRDTLVLDDGSILAIGNHNTPNIKDAISKPVLYLISAEGKVLETKYLEREFSCRKTFGFWQLNKLSDGRIQIIGDLRENGHGFANGYSFTDVTIY